MIFLLENKKAWLLSGITVTRASFTKLMVCKPRDSALNLHDARSVNLFGNADHLRVAVAQAFRGSLAQLPAMILSAASHHALTSTRWPGSVEAGSVSGASPAALATITIAGRSSRSLSR